MASAADHSGPASEPPSSPSKESSRVFRGGVLNIAGAVCQQGCLLITTALIARTLGESLLGQYVVAYAVLMIVHLASLFGFRATLTRYVAVYLADDDAPGLRGTLRFAQRSVMGATVGLSLLLAIGAEQLSDWLNGSVTSGGIVAVAATLPALTYRELALAATQGWRTQKAFAVIGWIFEPVTRLVLTAGALLAGMRLDGVFAALVVSTWISAILAGKALHRRTRTVPSAHPRSDTRQLLSYSLVSWVSTLASTGLIWADSLLLGGLVGSASVGVYNVSTRLVSLAVFVMAPINAAFAPHFAHFFHREEWGRLTSAYASSTNWILRLSLPAFAILVVFPAELLSLFGPGFKVGVIVTIFLAVGQLINALTGPCGTLLNMAGYVKLNLANNIFVLLMNIGLNFLLIPPLGIKGAAIAWTSSLAMVNVARLVETKLVLGMHPFNSVTLRALGAAVVSGTVGAVLHTVFLPDTMIGTVAGIVCLMALYVLLSIMFGMTREERSMIGAIRRRTGPSPAQLEPDVDPDRP